MDFARRQLEKYGWSDGKGLGKHENGISEALKPKLKRSVTGIGHDAAAEFNEHWWEQLYNNAATNIQVEERNGKTKRIKADANFEITNSMFHLKKKKKSSKKGVEYQDYFVKKATLTNGAVKIEKFNESDSDEEQGQTRDVFKMTDDELFAACGGRTAHKGARHGLKALGKLARIEEQEQKMLSLSKYEGYSKAKKIKESVCNEMTDVNTQINRDSSLEMSEKKKRKNYHKDVIDNIVDDDDGIKEYSNNTKDNAIDTDCDEIKEKRRKRNKNIEREKSDNFLQSKGSTENSVDNCVGDSSECFVSNKVNTSSDIGRKNKKIKKKNKLENVNLDNADNAVHDSYSGQDLPPKRKKDKIVTEEDNGDTNSEVISNEPSKKKRKFDSKQEYHQTDTQEVKKVKKKNKL